MKYCRLIYKIIYLFNITYCTFNAPYSSLIPMLHLFDQPHVTLRSTFLLYLQLDFTLHFLHITSIVPFISRYTTFHMYFFLTLHSHFLLYTFLYFTLHFISNSCYISSPFYRRPRDVQEDAGRDDQCRRRVLPVSRYFYPDIRTKCNSNDNTVISQKLFMI